MRTFRTNYAHYAKLCTLRTYYATIMQITQITEQLRTNYAQIMQILRENNAIYAKLLKKATITQNNAQITHKLHTN